MKHDYFSANNIKHIDYKDTDILKKFLGPSGKILPRKRSGLSSKNQRKLALAVKRSRFMGLIPFIIK
ncbi:MAG: 30S ribosomal protein S18 [Candidatus Pacebacteria bacterium]|jgi:small subunit ribosomal protein S18|nr:30S ribosomal protein S18 [Candidatus Paceibacterota bacterium]MBP7805255.1 30S ribosomal protein S18 [Candidatus Paceibacterota bacterium]